LVAPKTITATRRFLELSRCNVTILNGEERGVNRIIDGEIFRIGKSPDNDLVLTEDTVSRYHCEIVRSERGPLLRDLGSTNGTLLDGAEIREAYLIPGSVITVGAVQLKIMPYAEKIDILPSERDRFGFAVGSSIAMREIFGLLEQLAPSDVTILLGGETGTGKDVLARSVHDVSGRQKAPFIVVDCGAVVGSLIESELFGHERGSFTGAIAQRRGAFELAHRGTLFLDEIGELPLDLQAKLLRAIEQRAFRRVGGQQEIKVDIRLLAASKRDLKSEVERGKFREDLYFRLAVVPIEVPPLRERREDIPRLVTALLRTFGKDSKEEPMQIDADLMRALCAHDWPGNVRELRNVLERAWHLTRALGQTKLTMAGVPLASIQPTTESTQISGGPSFNAQLSFRENKARWEEYFERRYVRWLLEHADGNISLAARMADMDRKYLHKLIKKYEES